MIRSIPVINTKRLTLCAMRPEDFDRFAEIWATSAVVHHISPPKVRAEAWNSFLRNAGHWQMTGFGKWSIQRQSDRQMIGHTGFVYAARGMGEDFDSYPEAGWLLTPDTQGSGLGTEAVGAAHDWFDRVTPGPLVAMMTEDNAPSRRLADRLGYRLMRQAEFEGDRVILLRRDGPPGSR